MASSSSSPLQVVPLSPPARSSTSPSSASLSSSSSSSSSYSSTKNNKNTTILTTTSTTKKSAPPPPPQQQQQQYEAFNSSLIFPLCLVFISSTQYIVQQRPQLLPFIYTGQIIPLLLYRIITYYRQGWSHYTLELCYFTNALLLLYIYAFPHSDTLFLICFGLINGPVLAANVVFRCSMLLSDFQRFITWHMHVMPVIVVFCLRWLPTDEKWGFNTCQSHGVSSSSSSSSCLYDKAPYLLLLLSLAATVGHAIIYNVYVWRIAPASVRAHPHYDNSYLFLARKIEGGGGSAFLTKVLNCWGNRGRVWSFTLCSQVFNALVIALAYACWVNMVANLVFMLVVVFVTAYYAGSYYVYMEKKVTKLTAAATAAAAAAAAASKAGSSSSAVMPLPSPPLPATAGGEVAAHVEKEKEEEGEEGEEEQEGEEEVNVLPPRQPSTAIVAEHGGE